MTTKSTVLILGASRGLGLAMAEEWLKRDAKVIATQRSASRDLSELQGRYPGSLEIETVDIVEAASVHALRERLGGHRIDVLFVNAGIDPSKPLELQRDVFWWGGGDLLALKEPFAGFRRVVCGTHRRHAGIVEAAYAVALDGGAGESGTLNAACFAPDGKLVDRIEA